MLKRDLRAEPSAEERMHSSPPSTTRAFVTSPAPVDRNLDHHFAAAFAFVGRDGQVAGRPHRVGQRKGDRDAPLDLAILVLGILPAPRRWRMARSSASPCS